MAKQEVNHPSHYKGNNGIEAIDAIEAATGFEGALHFCQGNALKYLFRAGYKEDNSTLQDFRKARWYINRAIEMLEKSTDGIYPEEARDAKAAPERTQRFMVSAVLHKNIKILHQPNKTPEEVAAYFEKRLAESNQHWSVDNVSVIRNEDKGD